MKGVALKMTGISKAFGGVSVLRDVAFEVRTGEVHALLGENGAGKSSLMKILMGIHKPDAGEYLVGGRPVRFASPAEAQQNRVSMVYQEFGLVDSMTVLENVLLGRLPTRFGRIRWDVARSTTKEILGRLGSVVSPDVLVGDLKVAEQQEVETARALSYDPLVFVMDEPSSALSRVEIENLYQLVRRLREHGVAIVYISHKLEEVFELADRVTVLRDGAVVGTYGIDELDMPLLIEKMTGKAVSAEAPGGLRPGEMQEAILEVRGLSSEGLFDDVSFSVGKGTIVGVAGVVGAGKSELARAIVGALPAGTRVKGSVLLDGTSIDVAAMTPNKARRLGIGFVSEDRQAEGIVQDQPVLFNTILPALNRVSVAFTLIAARARGLVQSIVSDVGLRPPDPRKIVRFLSGGNQQKVVIGKWLAAQSKLLILDEPTRGIDIGSRHELYAMIRRQAKDHGLGVLLLSSDLREVLSASDVILVMVEGRLVDRVAPDKVTERDLLGLVVAKGSRIEASEGRSQ